MKRIAIFALLAAAAFLSAGCHAQVPVTNWQADLAWQLPTVPSGSSWSGCTTSTPCVFAVSVATIAAGGTCPAVTGTAYALLETTAAQATSAVDTTANIAGTTRCYIVQTQQVIAPATVPATSAPTTPELIAIPANPGVPTAPAVIPQATTTAESEPVPNPFITEFTRSELASNPQWTPTGLTVRLVARGN